MSGISINTVKDALLYKLRANDELMALINDSKDNPVEEGNIYKSWINSVPQELITFPCITIITDGSKENSLMMGEDIYIRIDVWADNTNKAQQVLDKVHNIINRQRFRYNEIYIALITKKEGSEAYLQSNAKSHAYYRYKLKIAL